MARDPDWDWTFKGATSSMQEQSPEDIAARKSALIALVSGADKIEATETEACDLIVAHLAHPSPLVHGLAWEIMTEWDFDDSNGRLASLCDQARTELARAPLTEVYQPFRFLLTHAIDESDIQQMVLSLVTGETSVPNYFPHPALLSALHWAKTLCTQTQQKLTQLMTPSASQRRSAAQKRREIISSPLSESRMRRHMAELKRRATNLLNASARPSSRTLAPSKRDPAASHREFILAEHLFDRAVLSLSHIEPIAAQMSLRPRAKDVWASYGLSGLPERAPTNLSTDVVAAYCVLTGKHMRYDQGAAWGDFTPRKTTIADVLAQAFEMETGHFVGELRLPLGSLRRALEHQVAEFEGRSADVRADAT